jgi:hypothetical protein
MNHQQIIELSREAGLSFVPEANSPLVKIVMRAVEMEREAIAQQFTQPYMEYCGIQIQEIIRKGEQQ